MGKSEHQNDANNDCGVMLNVPVAPMIAISFGPPPTKLVILENTVDIVIESFYIPSLFVGMIYTIN